MILGASTYEAASRLISFLGDQSLRNAREPAKASARQPLPTSTSLGTYEPAPTSPGPRHLPAWVQRLLFGSHPPRPSVPTPITMPSPIAVCSFRTRRVLAADRCNG